MSLTESFSGWKQFLRPLIYYLLPAFFSKPLVDGSDKA